MATCKKAIQSKSNHIIKCVLGSIYVVSRSKVERRVKMASVFLVLRRGSLEDATREAGTTLDKEAFRNAHGDALVDLRVTHNGSAESQLWIFPNGSRGTPRGCTLAEKLGANASAAMLD